MPYLKDERPQTIGVEGTWNLSAYHYKGSLLMAEYVKGLKKKKLIGSFCPGCAKVIVPPNADDALALVNGNRPTNR